jgi:alpha-ketoglutarate-dependent 2,4-dichlorophenoxyacetate dioxygenase
MTQLKVTPLHPTFAAELQGVDWSKPISPEQYKEIREVVDKVCDVPWALGRR